MSNQCCQCIQSRKDFIADSKYKDESSRLLKTSDEHSLCSRMDMPDMRGSVSYKSNNHTLIQLQNRDLTIEITRVNTSLARISFGTSAPQAIGIPQNAVLQDGNGTHVKPHLDSFVILGQVITCCS